jgi:hypothetical protein
MKLFSRWKRNSSDDITSHVWIKSSLSVYNGNCVEVAGLDDDLIRVRDSKNPRGAVLNFTHDEWDAFLGGVAKGEFKRVSRSK